VYITKPIENQGHLLQIVKDHDRDNVPYFDG